jgi:hypothetical protein
LPLPQRLVSVPNQVDVTAGHTDATVAAVLPESVPVDLGDEIAVRSYAERTIPADQVLAAELVRYYEASSFAATRQVVMHRSSSVR